ncbi:hypothetical protein [Candidatus Chloroploca sp. Khr17]|uniref:hypothetical protein n=1 Tax=Candidatus Chloroploca sp. Khr17 TaxID=2496869 RepID=UPI00101CF81E|nr:hypothetical protein [Candidatus Chloroploca sp. Khr17]
MAQGSAWPPEPDLPPSSAQESSFDDEQRFSEWIQKRLAIYQTLEQQIQTSIQQTVEFGGEFTRQLEQETERFIARYRRQRQEQIQMRDALRQELADLRMALAEERRQHEQALSQARHQADQERAQTRQQVAAEVAQQRASAKADCERMIREAQVEREQILAETQQMSAQLMDLQRSLSNMLKPMSSVGLPPASTSEAKKKTELAERSYARVSEAPSTVTPPPVRANWPEPSVRPFAPDAPLFQPDPEPQQIVEATSSGESAVVVEPAPSAEPASPTAPPEQTEYMVHFKNVQSFIIASDLLDRIGNLNGIESTRLVEYEHQQLSVAVSYQGAIPLERMLKERLSEVTVVVDVVGQ